MRISELKTGDKFTFDPIILTEEDIIEFATQFDPLYFHTNPIAAKKSIFKGLVASGPQIFIFTHKKYWIPKFGASVMAGLEINNWKFLKPVYPEQKIFGSAEIIDLKANSLKGSAIITWKYEFKNDAKETVKSLKMTILHKLD